MTDQMKVREAFEAWARSAGYKMFTRVPDDELYMKSRRGHYSDFLLDSVWDAWQAALAHASSATVKENLTVGEGEEVAWRWRDDVRPGLPWRTTPDREVMEKLRAAGCYEIEPLYPSSATSAEDARDAKPVGSLQVGSMGGLHIHANDYANSLCQGNYDLYTGHAPSHADSIDSARYRFLRSSATIHWNDWVAYECLICPESEREKMDRNIDSAIARCHRFDHAIDAAMAEGREVGK